jgi:hypothetical protein
MLAGLTLVIACGGCDDTSKGGKAQASSTSTTGVTAPGVTSTTKPRIPFAQGVTQMQAALVAAKGDPCRLYNFPTQLQSIDNPSTADEGKTATEMLTTYFMEVADVMQSQHPSQATALRTEATKYSAAAAKVNYNLTDPSVNSESNDKAFQQAFATFQQENSNCGDGSSTTTTTVGK